MIMAFIPFAFLLALLVVAAAWDVASFTIPNTLQLGLVLAFIAFALLAPLPLSVVGMHVLAGLAALALGFALFAFGYIGGGDAKLLAAVALWLGFGDLPAYVLVACVFGGALSLGILVMRKWPLPAALARQNWLLRLHDPKAGVPYGVALAAGLFVILPQTDVYLRVFAG